MTIKGSFKIDVFDCTVYVTVADDINRSLNYYLRKDGFDPERERMEAYWYRAKNGIGKQYIFFKSTDLTTNAVAHEKSHLAESILMDRNISIKGEIRAYLEGCISEKLNAFFKRRKLKIKN